MAKAPKQVTPESARAALGSAMRYESIGRTGLKQYSGYVDEEFIKDLRGPAAIRKYREMADNDPTIGAMLFAIQMILRAAEWTIEPAQPATDDMAGGDNFAAAAEAEAEFVDSVLFRDMDHTWSEFVAEALSMLVYGWSFHEVVYKLRRGPDQTDPRYRSEYTDGRIGVRRLPIRSQDSLDRWEFDKESGDLVGMWQNPPDTAQMHFIPLVKALHFRPISHKANPEGRSILRNAYKPWYYLTKIEEIEAIGIERELAGLPVLYLPSELMKSEEAADVATMALYTRLVRDVRYNRQGATILPSDEWQGVNGPSGRRQVELQLLTSGGQRQIDTVPVVARYQNDMARTVMAEFLMLGSSSAGSFALSDDKTDMFARAVVAIGDALESPINRNLIPSLWAFNSLDRDLMPTLKCGKIGPENLDVLGKFLQSLSAAGAPLFPDINLEQALRRLAKVPEKTPEIMQEQDEAREAAMGALAQANSNDPPKPGSADDDGDNGPPQPAAKGRKGRKRAGPAVDL